MFCGNLGVGVIRERALCRSFPRTPKGSRVHCEIFHVFYGRERTRTCVLPNVFVCFSLSSLLPEGSERLSGPPEPKMSRFIKDLIRKTVV